MKKLIPYLRLALFCVAIFGASGAVVLLKQYGLLAGKAKDSDGAAGEHGEGGQGESPEALAAMPSGLDGGHESKEPAGASGAKEEVKRQGAIAAGRALFQVPEPLSIADATDLLNDLRKQKQAYEQRKAAQDQRERELTTMERELETRRTEILGLLERVNAAVPNRGTGEGDASGAGDPEVLATLGKILELTQPDAAAKALSGYSPEQAARVLLAMDTAKSAKVVGQLEGEKLSKIMDALWRMKSETGE